MSVADLAAAVAGVSRLGLNADILLQAVENRAALAGLELDEARQRLARLLFWSIGGLVASILAGMTLTFVVAAAFWDTPARVLALVILGVLELITAAAATWYVYSQWKYCAMFRDSRDQLTKDCACLREILTTSPR